ncbi:hypothetical protein [Stenotrophomonas maltophilia]|uniref:hypothetical protein n=1 Tax=Stenotrophomonas maltophilia TaxID=40324 RepID=UPI00066C344F|nr:hypothetical protein [Stenotrophomonas maltophilia]ASE52199.1 hypothetical protein CEQ03_05195 [Stenotrophomonas maltophilia]MBH1421275.1 hypothetical protein [Stenotrophomonas maltophilia]MBN5055251.1 hypothetical protein [Stenotrophomonas maltophilia]MBN5096072.1 hypothetical protein [Stenotrophomonas maltophilia]MBN5114404.1 hypothetical protein [Stenotrophomonas maltophilia]
MSGGRHTGWTPIVVVGDRAAASLHMPAGRKLLGFVTQEAARNGLGIASARQEADDGTLIVAEKIGELTRLTIITPEPEPPLEPLEPMGGFILWPRWNVHTGDPADRGSQVDPTGENPSAWLEFSGRRLITRYWKRWDVVDSITGARYESYNQPDRYPAGLHFFGNVDWKDGRDLALSFYGYGVRYLRDLTLIDDGARWIFQQGQILFDRIAYRDAMVDTPPDYLSWRLTSGCLRRGADGHHELVVTFTHYVINQPTTAQSAFVVFRVTRSEGTPEKGDWEVVQGSHRLLGMTPGRINPQDESSANGFNDAALPWFFNADGTKAIRTVSSEPTTVFGLVNTMTQEVEISGVGIDHRLSRADYLIGDYTNALGAFALVAPTRGLVASDYAGSERRDAFLALRLSQGQVATEATGYRGTLRVLVVLEFDGGELPLIDRDFSVGNDRQDYHLLAYMDLRHNLYSGWRIQGVNGVHSIQPFAYMGGRLLYGEIEAVDWDPASGLPAPFLGLDTRAPGGVVDGLVFGNYWTGASGSGWGPRDGTQHGVIWRKHPREGLVFFSAAASLRTAMVQRQGVTDFLGFDWSGGWNYCKGRYCVSIPGPYTGTLNYLTGYELGAVTGVIADDRRFYPLTSLPKPI